MKKVLVLFVVLIMLGGCSAQKKSEPPIPDFNFSGNMSVTYNNFDMVCKIENSLADKCVVTVVEPELISGFTMTVKDGVFTFELGDVSYDVNPSGVIGAEFVSAFLDSINDVLNTTTYEKLENGNWLYSGMSDFGKFLLVQDSVTGYPSSFRIPEAGLTITFSDMKPI